MAESEPMVQPPEGELTRQQLTVIERLTAGESAVSAAAAAGVHRNTVHRWLRADAGFQAAYNAWRADLQAAARARLLALTEAAVTTISTAVAKGDARMALAVLERQGLLQPVRPGPTDPAHVARRQAVERRRAAAKLLHEEDFADVDLPTEPLP